ncbi:hypothetical protein [Herbaspirillum sp. NPDC101397]|uniref:hypothetical protein n=1 Tax=Herbaspirillum sp. NPDC101397 TaxID=3364006 RepID=UPI00383A4E5D
MGIFSIVYSAFTVIWMAVVLIHTFFNLSPSDWASWVQAVGSIAAVIGAIEVGRRQRVGDRETAIVAASLNAERLQSVVKAVIDDAYQQCLDVRHVFEVAEKENKFAYIELVTSYDTDSFQKSIDRVQAIPLFELHSEEIAKNVVSFQANILRLSTWLATTYRIVIGPTLPSDKDLDLEQVTGIACKYLDLVKSDYLAIVKATQGIELTEGRPFGRWTS